MNTHLFLRNNLIFTVKYNQTKLVSFHIRLHIDTLFVSFNIYKILINNYVNCGFYVDIIIKRQVFTLAQNI